MLANVKAKDTSRHLKLRNILIVLKERRNGYERPKAILVPVKAETKKEKRSKWLAGDPSEFIRRIQMIKLDIDQFDLIKDSIVNKHSFQTEPNVIKSTNHFKNNRYESCMTESDPYSSYNPEREREKEEKKKEELFSSTLIADLDSVDKPDKKLIDFLENPFIASTPPHKGQISTREDNYLHFKQSHEAFGTDLNDLAYDDYDYDAYPIYSNNKFDQAAHPLSMSLNLYSTPKPFDKNAEGRHSSSHPRNYNSENHSHRLKKLINHYFFVKENEEEESRSQRFTYTLSYMKDLKQWNISKQSLLLTERVQDHLDDYALIERVYLDDEGNQIEHKDEVDETALLRLAERSKRQLKRFISQNSIKANIRELLNAITIDNYSSVKDDLVALIKGSQANQITFIEVLFIKAIHERLYSGIYAKLCKDIDRTLTNKREKTKSPMRENLIDTCKKSFKDKSVYYPVTDDKEVIAHYLIGCVNFFAELINVQMISKKVGIQCIKALVERYALIKEGYIVEAAIVLLGKFASIIARQSNKIRKEDYELFKEQIDLRCNELDDLSKSNANTLPSHILYKIINLLHKKNNGWMPTLYEQSQILAFPIEYVNTSSSRDYNEGDNDMETTSYSNSSSIAQSKRKSDMLSGVDIEYEPDQNPMKDNNSSTYDIIAKDLKDWIIFIQNGNYKSNYQWKDIEDLYSSRIAYMDQIVSCYLTAALEHYPSLKTQKAKNALHDYLRELINYYGSKLSQKEVDGIVDDLMKKIKAFALMKSNKSFENYKEILVNVLYCLLKYNIIQMRNFNALCKEKYNTPETVIDLLMRVILMNPETKNGWMNSFKATKLYKENVELVNSYLKYK